MLLTKTPPRFAYDDERGFQKLYAALKAPMRVQCVECHTIHNYLLPLERPILDDHLLSLYHPPLEDESEDDDDVAYTKWAIDTDNTVQLSRADKVKFKDRLDVDVFVVPIEIKSRILDLIDPFETTRSRSHPNHTHKITYHEEITAVFKRLKEEFSEGEFASENRLVINESTSTHVHIGNSHHGFPLETIKNVMSVLVAHERQFDSIHATDRITGIAHLSHDLPWDEARKSPMDATVPMVYNSPCSFHMITSAFAHCKPLESATGAVDIMSVSYPGTSFDETPALRFAAQKCDVASWLTLIEHAASLDDIAQFQDEMGHESTINLENLREQGAVADPELDVPKMTIEFRQHAGTLQPTEILNWIGVLVGLFKYANTTRASDVKAMCLRNWTDPSMTMLDLLKVFGYRSEEDIVQHYARLAGGIGYRLPYADLVKAQELDAIRRFASNDRFVPIMQHLIERRARNIHPDPINALIDRKFAIGGYGQFSKSYLDQIRSDELETTERNYLTLGFYPLWSEGGRERQERSSDGQRTSVLGEVTRMLTRLGRDPQSSSADSGDSGGSSADGDLGGFVLVGSDSLESPSDNEVGGVPL